MLPSRMKLNGCATQSESSVCNLFAAFFASNYSNAEISQAETQNVFPIEDRINFGSPVIDSIMVREYLERLPVMYSYGPDYVPNAILKFCSDSLAEPLTRLFLMSLNSGIFPREWKRSFIFPVYKKGPRNEISNYRGIAKLSAIPKLFEHIITDQISNILRSYLSNAQHGFIKGRSTMTNLLHFSNFVISGYTKGHQTDVIFMDFTKAFDSVHHQLLLTKLKQMGIDSFFLKWLASYLTERVQFALFNDEISEPIKVTSGVPQGSHLGPILFLLYIDDLPMAIKHSEILLYADDAKIFKMMDSPEAVSQLQQDIDNITHWCKNYRLALNVSKCNVMSFSRKIAIENTYIINDYVLNRVHLFKDLGIWLDRKLTFNEHIDLMVNTAKSVLGLLKRWSKEFQDPYVTKALFTTLVRPILEYGAVLWNPQYCTYSDRIESVQKQFLLFALRHLNWSSCFRLPPYEGRLKLIKLDTLVNRRRMLCSLFIFKLLTGEIDCPFLLGKVPIAVPSRCTRCSNALILSRCRSNYEAFDPFRVLCKIYNECFHVLDYSMSVFACRRALLSIN